MTLNETKLQFAQDLAKMINESHLPPTVIRNVLADMDRVVAKIEEEAWQKSLEKEYENNG